MVTIHHSELLKADKRKTESVDGCTIYTAVSAHGIVVRDVFLSAAAEVNLSFPEFGQVIILAVVGAPVLHQTNGSTFNLSASDIFNTVQTGSDKLVATNPFPEEIINFLHITLTQSANPSSAILPNVNSLSITEKNHLVVGTGNSKNIRAGVYDGRKEDVVSVNPEEHVLVYIINGAFEVEGRLLEYRDALTLWNKEQIEFEALSEAAIILLIEF